MPSFLKRPTPAALAMAALLATACGGDGDSRPGTDGTAPATGSYALTVQVSGLPQGASLPLTHEASTDTLNTATPRLRITGNNYNLTLGRLALPGASANWVQCTFAQPLAGALQSDGSLRIALGADATQTVQCQHKIFATLQRHLPQNNTPATGVELMTANRDGSQAAWLPGRPSLTKASSDSNKMAVLLNNEILFSGRDSDLNSRIGQELRATDGTEAGTRLVKDILVEPGVWGSMPSDFTVFGNKLYFSATTQHFGASFLHVSDGTEAGTQPVLFNGSQISIPEDLTVVGDTLLFKAQSKVYAINTAGTVADLGLTAYGSFHAVGSRVFLTDSDRKQWLTDGTPGRTRQIQGSYVFGVPIEFQDDLYFTGARTATDYPYAFYKTDGSEAGTQRIKAIAAGNPFHELNGKLIFTVRERGITGVELWTSDGTEAGTQILKDAIPGPSSLSPQNILAVNGKLLFLSQEGADDPASPHYVWVTDGSADGTHRLSSDGAASFAIKVADSTNWVKLNEEQLLFVIHKGDVSSTVGQAWITDGTPEGTRLLRDANDQPFEVYSGQNNAL